MNTNNSLPLRTSKWSNTLRKTGKYLLFFLLTLLFFIITRLLSHAQTVTALSDTGGSRLGCGTDADYILHHHTGPSSPGYGLTAPASFSSSAIFTCGKIDVYYEDINRHFHTGFDDTTVATGYGGVITTKGALRRNTFCAVLSQIQATYDFSNVSDTAHLRIYVDTSLAPGVLPAVYPTTFYARAAPNYDTAAGIKKGWFADYVTSPSWYLHDSIPSSLFHCTVQVNFDHIVTSSVSLASYQDDYNYPLSPLYNCYQLDLFTILTHEMTHCMGWISFMTAVPIDSVYVPYPYVALHTFSTLDWSMHVAHNNYPLTLTKVISGTPTYPTLDNTNPLLYVNGNYWINGSNTPLNHPIYSSGSAYSSFLSHLDDQQGSYTFRQRVSPGDQQEYLMSPYTLNGVFKRGYSKGEVQTMVNVLGYTLTTDYEAANPYTMGNQLPFSKKMATYNINAANYGYFTETVTPDTVITNNAPSTSVTINISSLYGSDLTDLDPADAGNIFIDTATLVNFRGCGTGNNHALLTVSSDAKSITYTPRPNFYGKAQLGFNITDGKERGGFKIITIEVLKGTNVVTPPDSNMVCNPTFEYGSEERRYLGGDYEGIANSIALENGIHEGKWQGISFLDAHPYSFYTDNIATGTFSSGAIVEYSAFTCGDSAYSTSGTGLEELTSGDYTGWGNPDPMDTGYRYQYFKSYVEAPTGSYFYLTDSVKHCHKYKLSFYYYKQSPDETVPLKIGFTDTLVNPHTTAIPFNYSFDASIAPDTALGWKQVVIPFHYCGTDPSQIMYIQDNNGIIFRMDNIALKEDTTADSPMIVHITADTPANCHIRLTATTLNSNCDVAYSWSTTDGMILSSPTADTVLVPSAVGGTYYVVANDGCRSAVDSATTISRYPSPIIAPPTICVGSTLTLTDSLAGGSWSSSDLTSAIIDPHTGVLMAISAHPVTITYNYCGHFVAAYIVIDSALPAITGASDGVCLGAITTLSDAATGGTWSSSSTAIATVDGAGVATGLALGTTTITYAISGGCYITAQLRVKTIPVLSAITGTLSGCVGTTFSPEYNWVLYDLSETAASSGTWSSANPAIATVEPYPLYIGYVTGLSAGTTTVTYTVNNGCGIATTTAIVTINTVPAVAGITGDSAVCAAGTASYMDSTSGGVWSTSNPAVAVIGATTGLLTAISSGTVTISYAATNLCGTSYKTKVVTVLPPLTITGGHDVCVGAVDILTASVSGGTWICSDPSVATISFYGLSYGASAGSVTIFYSTSASCSTTFALTVDPNPTAISGSTVVCIGQATTFSDGITGGSWTSSTPAVVTVGASSGVVTGVSSGLAIISYTTAAGCLATTTVTVNTAPSTITGIDHACVGTTITLNDAVTGGSWSSSNTAIATVSSLGVVTGTGAGSATITYTLPSGCISTMAVTVSGTPAPITGTASVCIGGITVLGDATTGGSWNSSDPAIAFIGAGTGIVTGLISGTVIMTYALPTGCVSTKIITVNPLPAAITGGTMACTGGTLTLSDATGGGSWSGGSAVATVSGAGIVTASGSGSVTVTYTLPTGCATTTTISAGGTATITGGNSFCMYAGANLTGTPSGGAWSSSNPTTAIIDPMGDVVGLATGTATITYTLSSGCTATEEIYIYGPTSGSCSPCSTFAGKPINTLGYGGTISGITFGAGNYYIPGDVTIDGDVTLTDAVVFVAPGATINVNPNSSFTVNGSHLFSCSTGMWKGINLNSDGSQTGRVALQGDAAGTSTLIEDAAYGVYVDNPVTPTGGGGEQYIYSNNAIFNRNSAGIYIGHYNPPMVGGGSDPHIYEFHIENSVFTSRDFSHYTTSAGAYPYVWPNNNGSTGALKNAAPYTSHYVLPYYVTQYPAAKCHNLLPAYAGIQLDSVGVLSDDYAGVLIGAPSTQILAPTSINSQLNIFEQLAFGIYASNSNVRSINSVYANMHYAIDKAPKLSPDYGNAGIYTNMTDGQKYQLRVEPGYYTDPTTGYTNESANSFYDCYYDVYSNDYYHIRGYKSSMFSSVGDQTNNSHFGYYLQSSSYDGIEVKHNYIYNVANGVLFMADMGASYFVSTGGGSGYYTLGTQNAGPINVDSNHIQAAWGTLVPDTEHVAFAISVQNAVNSTGPMFGVIYPTGEVHTDHNTITNAYRGIQVQSFWKQPAFTLNNLITVWKDPAQGSISYGINHTDCAKDMVMANSVTGNIAGSGTDDSVRGYYNCYNSGMEMGCNTANSTGRGFEFFQSSPATNWHDNTMSNNRVGMYLNSGAIDQQGSLDHPTNNVWDVSSDWSDDDHLQTYVDGPISAINSQLWVKSGTETNPINNNSQVPLNKFSETTSSIMVTVPAYSYNCWTVGGVGGGVGAGARHAYLHQQFAKKQINYQFDSAGKNFLGQYLTYQSVLNDTTLIDTSATLQSFKALAINSRFAYLKSIETSLAQGNTDDATAKLDTEPSAITDSSTYVDSTTGVIVADDHNSDYIVDNYKEYYRLYRNYLIKSLTSDDSTEIEILAGECPSRYGTAVYRSRCLYTLVSCQLKVWNDDSCTAADTGTHVAARTSKPPITSINGTDQVQAYQLFPNPNNGIITLSQLEADSKAVEIEVYDVIGRSMYKNSAQFTGGTYGLQLGNLKPGVYMLQITDCNKKRFNFKFVKE